MKKNKKRLFVLFLVLYLISIPFLVYAISNWSWMDLSGKNNIGDALGGITNPIIGTGGIILTFLAFYIQYKFNLEQSELIKLQRDERKEEKNENEVLKKINFLDSEITKIEKNIFELSEEYHSVRKMEKNINTLKIVDSLIKRYIYLYMTIDSLTSEYVKDSSIKVNLLKEEVSILNRLFFLNKVYLEVELIDFFEIIDNLFLYKVYVPNEGFYKILRLEQENNSKSMKIINNIITKYNEHNN